MKKNRLLIILSYATIYIVWGSTYFFIKMAVETIPPLYVIGVRWTLGGSAILILSALRGRIDPRPTLRQIGVSALLGSMLLLVGNGLITLAERKVDSYLVALILAAIPMIVALFDRLLLNTSISMVRLAGVALGMAGVGVLLYDGHSLGGSLPPEILMVIGGVTAWGFATSLSHRLEAYPDTLVNSGFQMAFVGLTGLAGAALLAPPLREVLPRVSLPSALGLAYLTTVGTLAFWAFTYLVAHEPGIRVSSFSLVNPVIAVLLGLLVGDESPVPLLAAGLPLILAGVSLMLYGELLLSALQRRLGTRAATDT
jgi:drug/metabolite transporter (DMT)-like permease